MCRLGLCLSLTLLIALALAASLTCPCTATLTLVQALGFLHKHNILYNDLKLENVLVQMDGYCKLADLGNLTPH